MKWLAVSLACVVCLSIGINLGQWAANRQNGGKTSYCVSYYGECGAHRGFNWYEITTDKPMRQAVDIANLIDGLKKYEPGSSNVVPICIYKFDR